MSLRTVPDPKRVGGGRGPLAWWAALREAVLVAREVPGEILLGIEARAELARARQVLWQCGWGDDAAPLDEAVVDLASAWSEAEQRAERYRLALDDIAHGRAPGVARAVEALR